ncbi:metallophosphoesterase [uncultured Sphingomonas sp.]|uniref:metallophosphoesterase family protein n=1 Tax=uncultured Sphingomonas sp. TaxID=158754 RepID=UPI0025FB2D05|nr:metallophosphoesterase [uncultured Sphingomonas sp.]
MTRLFHVSDIHFGREDQAAVRWFADMVHAERPDAVVCTGDLTMRARSHEFEAAGAWLKSLDVPVTVEVGNHDLPYFNPFARLLNPYRRYQAVESMIEAELDLPGVLVVPLKTTARFQLRNLSHGRVSRSGLKAALAMLADKPAGSTALIAAHHPLIRTDFVGHGDTIRGPEALTMLAEAGADAVLSGHVHDAFDVEHRHAGRTIRLIGAGTLSRRVRSTPPSFNEIAIGRGRLDVTARTM